MSTTHATMDAAAKPGAAKSGAEKSGGKKPVMPRKVKGGWFLTALIVNLALIGLLITPILMPHPPLPTFGAPDSVVDYLTRKLPPGDAAIVREAYKKTGPVLATAGHELEIARRKVSDALHQPKVDQQDLKQALDDVAAAHVKIQKAMSDFVRRVARDLSPEGRRIFAEQELHAEVATEPAAAPAPTGTSASPGNGNSASPSTAAP